MFSLKLTIFEGLNSPLSWFACISFVGIMQFYWPNVSINTRVSFIKLKNKLSKNAYRNTVNVSCSFTKNIISAIKYQIGINKSKKTRVVSIGSPTCSVSTWRFHFGTATVKMDILNNFLNYFNLKHHNIYFGVDAQKGNCIAFLDIKIFCIRKTLKSTE